MEFCAITGFEVLKYIELMLFFSLTKDTNGKVVSQVTEGEGKQRKGNI